VYAPLNCQSHIFCPPVSSGHYELAELITPSIGYFSGMSTMLHVRRQQYFAVTAYVAPMVVLAYEVYDPHRFRILGQFASLLLSFTGLPLVLLFWPQSARPAFPGRPVGRGFSL
jgi:hypothetical protein